MPPRTCFTYGQWRQMNITRSASASAKSASLTVSPVVTSLSAKSGASVPSGSIWDETAIAPRLLRLDGTDRRLRRIGRQEREQTASFLLDGGHGLLGDPLEGLDLEDDPATLARRPPERPRVPVHQHQTPVAAREDPRAMRIWQHARAIGVRERHVVELRKEPQRR